MKESGLNSSGRACRVAAPLQSRDIELGEKSRCRNLWIPTSCASLHGAGGQDGVAALRRLVSRVSSVKKPNGDDDENSHKLALYGFVGSGAVWWAAAVSEQCRWEMNRKAGGGQVVAGGASSGPA